VPRRNGTDTRRSTRVTLRVPMKVYEPGTNHRFRLENAYSLKVSLWGGLIVLKSIVNMGQKLVVVNQATDQTKEAHVVYLGPMDLDSRVVGFEFLEPSPDFWGLSFPAVVPRRSPARSAYA
jgi:hypothetical protein